MAIGAEIYAADPIPANEFVPPGTVEG